MMTATRTLRRGRAYYLRALRTVDQHGSLPPGKNERGLFPGIAGIFSTGAYISYWFGSGWLTGLAFRGLAMGLGVGIGMAIAG